MPNVRSAIIVPAELAHTKKWIYELSERVSSSNKESRVLAYNVVYLLEYIQEVAEKRSSHFSVPFCPKYNQLFAAMLVDLALETTNDRQRCPSANIDKLVSTGFAPQQYGKLREEIKDTLIEHMVFQEKSLQKTLPSFSFTTLMDKIEDLLIQIPQTDEIRHAVLTILDQFTLTNRILKLDESEKIKLTAASIAVARAWVSKKEGDHCWPEDYYKKTKLTFKDIKSQYSVLRALAKEIQKINRIRGRQEQILQDLTTSLEKTTQKPEVKQQATELLKLFSLENPQKNLDISEGNQVVAACIYLARFLNKEKSPWPEDYVGQFGLKITDFQAISNNLFRLFTQKQSTVQKNISQEKQPPASTMRK